MQTITIAGREYPAWLPFAAGGVVLMAVLMARRGGGGEPEDSATSGALVPEVERLLEAERENTIALMAAQSASLSEALEGYSRRIEKRIQTDQYTVEQAQASQLEALQAQLAGSLETQTSVIAGSAAAQSGTLADIASQLAGIADTLEGFLYGDYYPEEDSGLGNVGSTGNVLPDLTQAMLDWAAGIGLQPWVGQYFTRDYGRLPASIPELESWAASHGYTLTGGPPPV